VPSARPGAVTLRLRRRDRAHAAMLVSVVVRSRAQMGRPEVPPAAEQGRLPEAHGGRSHH
jgi:hypothetical protein